MVSFSLNNFSGSSTSSPSSSSNNDKGDDNLGVGGGGIIIQQGTDSGGGKKQNAITTSSSSKSTSSSSKSTTSSSSSSSKSTTKKARVHGRGSGRMKVERRKKRKKKRDSGDLESINEDDVSKDDVDDDDDDDDEQEREEDFLPMPSNNVSEDVGDGAMDGGLYDDAIDMCGSVKDGRGDVGAEKRANSRSSSSSNKGSSSNSFNNNNNNNNEKDSGKRKRVPEDHGDVENVIANNTSAYTSTSTSTPWDRGGGYNNNNGGGGRDRDRDRDRHSGPPFRGGGGDGRGRYDSRGDGSRNNNNNSNYHNNNDGGGGRRFNNNNGGGGGGSSRRGNHYGGPSRGGGDRDRGGGGGGQSRDGNRHGGPSRGSGDHDRYDDRGGKGDNRYNMASNNDNMVNVEGGRYSNNNDNSRNNYDSRGGGNRNNNSSNYHNIDRGGGRRFNNNNGGGGGGPSRRGNHYGGPSRGGGDRDRYDNRGGDHTTSTRHNTTEYGSYSNNGTSNNNYYRYHYDDNNVIDNVFVYGDNVYDDEIPAPASTAVLAPAPTAAPVPPPSGTASTSSPTVSSSVSGSGSGSGLSSLNTTSMSTDNGDDNANVNVNVNGSEEEDNGTTTGTGTGDSNRQRSSARKDSKLGGCGGGDGGGKSKRKGPPSPPADEVANAIGTTGVQASSHYTAGSALSTIDSSSETLSPSPPTDEVANAIGTTGVQASSHDTAGSALPTIDSSSETLSPSPPTDEVANAIGTTDVQASSHDTAGSALSTIDSSSETLSPSSDPSDVEERDDETTMNRSSDNAVSSPEHLALLKKLNLVLSIIDKRDGPLKRINEVKNILYNDNPNEKDFVIALGEFMGSIRKNMNINPTEENTVKILKFLVEEHEFNSKDAPHMFSKIFEVLQRTTFGEKNEEKKPLCLDLDRIHIIHEITNADDSRGDPRLLWLLYNPYTPDQANIPEGRGICTHNGYCYNVEIILLRKRSPLEHAEQEFVTFRRKSSNGNYSISIPKNSTEFTWDNMMDYYSLYECDVRMVFLKKTKSVPSGFVQPRKTVTAPTYGNELYEVTSKLPCVDVALALTMRYFKIMDENGGMYSFDGPERQLGYPSDENGYRRLDQMHDFFKLHNLVGIKLKFRIGDDVKLFSLQEGFFFYICKYWRKKNSEDVNSKDDPITKDAPISCRHAGVLDLGSGLVLDGHLSVKLTRADRQDKDLIQKAVVSKYSGAISRCTIMEAFYVYDNNTKPNIPNDVVPLLKDEYIPEDLFSFLRTQDPETWETRFNNKKRKPYFRIVNTKGKKMKKKKKK